MISIKNPLKNLIIIAGLAFGGISQAHALECKATSSDPDGGTPSISGKEPNGVDLDGDGFDDKCDYNSPTLSYRQSEAKEHSNKAQRAAVGLERSKKNPLVLQDDAGSELELICPADCELISVENHHGEVDSFCDCDGDGKRDEACQIWLKDYKDDTQRTFCQQQGCGQGEQCVKETKEFPSGEIQQSCECDSPFCDDIEEK